MGGSSSNCDQYAVFGDPIAQSKSPLIHAAFAKQTQQKLEYTKHQVNAESFSTAAQSFFESGGRGLNITAPCKLEAFAFADELSERAKRAGAVNTLIHDGKGLVRGDTTDGVGLVNDLRENLGWALRDKRVLILGAGGAVRGVLEPLLAECPSELMIANRTASKAAVLAKDFSNLAPTSCALLSCGFEDLGQTPYDVLINGTSSSLTGELPPLPDNLLAPNAACYDMSYAAEPTIFMRWAKQEGAAEIADGLGMLVGQAAESFKLWRGVAPETQAVIEELRAGL